jgi:hypothetical protein
VRFHPDIVGTKLGPVPSYPLTSLRTCLKRGIFGKIDEIRVLRVTEPLCFLI